MTIKKEKKKGGGEKQQQQQQHLSQQIKIDRLMFSRKNISCPNITLAFIFLKQNQIIKMVKTSITPGMFEQYLAILF